MKWHCWILAIIFGLAVGGVIYLCFHPPKLNLNIAGGGGSTHLPPAVIVAGKSTVLQIKLWPGEPGVFTQVVCHYNTIPADSVREVPMNRVGMDGQEAIFECQLPPFDDGKTSKVVYFIDMLFDGVYTRQDVAPIPVVPATSPDSDK